MNRLNGILLTTLLAASFVGCGGDDNPPTLTIDIFGYGPDIDGETRFVSGLPSYEGANEVVVSVTQPFDRRVLSSETFSATSGNASLPEVAYGDNLRMEMTVLDSAGQPLAWGGSPLFEFEPGLDRRSFRVQVNEINGFSPVGSVVIDRETQLRKFSQTRFDYRATNNEWLGRAGHTSATLSDGRVLIVGGAQFTPGGAPNAEPNFEEVYDDVQVFDPETGYFTDLSADESSEITGEVGSDRLISGVVHGVLTPVGDDRFILTGGYTLRNDDEVVPSNTIQIIDMNAPAGTRIQRLIDESGSNKVLRNPRAFHSATYRPSDNNIIVAGGMGAGGETDVLKSVEVIDLDSGEVTPAEDLAQRRAEHTAILMGDTSTVWLVGGRDATTVHSSSEVLTFDGDISVAEGPELQVARFGHSAIRMSPGSGNLIMVAGGFTELDGTPTNRFEVSNIERDSFQGTGGWVMSKARGRATIHELPISNDIVVIGGLDAEGSRLADADRLVFQDLVQSPPYTPELSQAGPRSHYLGTSTLLGSGHVLLVGGIGVQQGNVVPLDSADYFTPYDPVEPAGGAPAGEMDGAGDSME